MAASLGDLVGRSAVLGVTPTEERIDCEFGAHLSKDGGLSFYVTNGAWNGRLYQTDAGFHLITERGDKHEPIFVVRMIEPRVPAPVTDEDRIPF